jgi:hypothetical protein
MTTTLAASASASIVMDPAASLTISDLNGKATIAFTSANDDVWPSMSVSNAQSKTYGPYGVTMSVVITAIDRSLVYRVDSIYDTTEVASSRDLTNADNGKTLECTGTVTLTVPINLQSNFGCAIIPNGTTSIASSGGALLNGATSTLTRAAASNAVFAIVPRASAANSYVVTGS